MVSHTPTWQDIVPTPTKQSWDILPNSTRVSDQPSPNVPCPLSPTTLPTAAPTRKDMPSNQVFIKVYPLSRLYTDDMGRFPIRACSSNQYAMIAFHADDNLILQQAFKPKSDRHQIAAYNAIMTCLAARGLSVDLQILNNKDSAEYKEAITFKWNAKFQLV
jgi:hypothetical protein